MRIPFKISSIKKRLKHKTTGTIFFCLLVVLIFLASYSRVFDPYENLLLDIRFRLRSLQPYSDKIVIIEVGNDTLERLSQWPLPRDFHASLIDVLSYFGVRQALFDVIFVEPTDNDKIFADSIKKAGNVYLPYVLRPDSQPTPNGLLEAEDYDAQIRSNLAKVSRGTGHINSPKDNDGKVRWVPLLIRYKDVLMPHLALRAACDYLNIDFNNIKFNKSHITIDDKLTIPTNESGSVLVNYVGRWESTFRHYSYVDILFAWKEYFEGGKPSIDLTKLNGAVCFIGLTATGTQDIHSIPLQNNYPMVGLHANIFNSILLNQYVFRANRWINLALLALLLVLLFLTIRKKRGNPLTAFLYMIVYCTGFTILGYLAFIFIGIWIDLFYPIAVMIAAYTGIRIYIFLQETRERELIERELSVAKQIQESFLPEPIEKFHTLEISAHMVTAKHIGGDLYDTQPLGDDKIGILIGDVSGKGVAASLTMARAMSLFRMLAATTDIPGELLFNLNNEIAKGMKSGIFVTATYLIYFAKARKVIIASAGHSATLVYRKKGSIIEKVEPAEGMPLGLMSDIDFSNEEITLDCDDQIVLYTDGVTEAKNLKREEFGDDKLLSIIQDHSKQSPKEMIDAIAQQIKKFAGKAPQHDDCTILVLKEKGG